MVNNFDPQNVIQSVWGTKAISVQLTDQVGWNSLRIFGYIVGGKRYMYIFLLYFHFFFFCSNRNIAVVVFHRPVNNIMLSFGKHFLTLKCRRFINQR